ncbi:AAA family ATPase [Polyangium sp. 6x1]|uniref:AAA family ATPase n=1 Tax=Polyangium sp. 6x1 TaxID=3042689 RepID=UPI002482FA56|nr:AAA family ATPase [Polyangium sp. 6x1]MDI1447252.1 AAA family ATPase [Polyangium sp. 6x1]
MSYPEATLRTVDRLSRLSKELKRQFFLRDEAVDILVLGAVCQEHVLLLGPPGTAKSDLLTRFAEQIDAPRFHYLLTRFTEPAEIFGPLDLPAFQEGRYHVRTEGMLPSATIAFLDEVFQGGSAILNTLLTLVNERVFHNGPVRQRVPLMSLVGASNELPDDPTLKAFADRFALRVLAPSAPDEGLGELLDRGWDLEVERLDAAKRSERGEGTAVVPILKESAVRALQYHLAEVKLAEVRPLYEQILRDTRAEGLELSDRRIVKGLKLVAGAALVAGREQAAADDLWPIKHAWSRPSDAPILRRVVETRIAEAGGAKAPRARGQKHILADLETLEEREGSLRGETAISAHLMALNRLRREVILDHPDGRELRERIEVVVRRVLARLEEA